MATFTFDGSTSQTTAFNATVDRVVFNLDASELASISEDRANNTVTIVATSGAVLTLTGTNLLALTPTSFVPGFDSDIVFGIGTDGPETLNGNVLVGLDGIDTLNASDLDGALVFGNAGDDEVSATGSNVRIYGGQGNDFINYNENVDPASVSLIVGGLGEDDIEVNNSDYYQGAITIYGGNEAGDPTDGADQIDIDVGGTSSTVIFGNGGDDVIDVGSDSEFVGTVSVYGGQGEDQIDVDVDSGTGVIYGGLGIDAIDAYMYEGGSVTVFGGNGAGDAADGGDFITVGMDDETGTALVYGNGGDDEITISDGVTSTVYGGQGNDVIGGTVGDGSLVYGGLGIDGIAVSVDGGTSAITVYGGNGNADAADLADSITVTLTTTPVAAPAPGIELPDEIQTAVVYGNGGNDLIALNGQGAATVFGGAGDDQISVQNGQYALTGGAGDDAFNFALAGNTTEDNLSSITDFMFGEDTIVFNSLVDSTTVGSATLATATDLQAIITAGGATENQVAIITVTGGDLAGSYAVNGEQVIDITGFTGTIDASAFSGQNAGPIFPPFPPI